MGEAAYGNEINAGGGDVANGVEVYAAAGFEFRAGAVTAQGDGVVEVGEGHVVEEDVIEAIECEEGGDLVEVIGLEFDFGIGVGLFEAVDGVLDGVEFAFGDEVVVLDHGAVVEAHAVVGAAAIGNGLFFEQSVARGGFAGVEDGGGSVADELDVVRGEGGDAAEALEEVEGGAFCGEDGAGGAFDGHQDGTGSHEATVFDEDAYGEGGIDFFKDPGGYGDTGNHALGADGDKGAHDAVGRDEELRGEIAGADVLGESEVDERFGAGVHGVGEVGGCGASWWIRRGSASQWQNVGVLGLPDGV